MMCIGMANGGKSLTEDLRKKLAETPMPTDTVDEIFESMHKQMFAFGCKIVEEQEELLMKTIQQIGGTEYSKITIDKNKVLDAFKKQIPEKIEIEVFEDFDEDTGKPYTMKFEKCSACGEHIGLKSHRFCAYCGQALDWSDIE